MARKAKVSQEELYEIATYLSRPEIKTEIHAELPSTQKEKFEEEYLLATNGYPLPIRSDQEPYYVWTNGANKYGRELRIYFLRVAPEPPLIRTLYTDNDKWRNGFRINHSNLVMQLFECGFILGMNTNTDRIKEFMNRKFPVLENGNS